MLNYTFPFVSDVVPGVYTSIGDMLDDETECNHSDADIEIDLHLFQAFYWEHGFANVQTVGSDVVFLCKAFYQKFLSESFEFVHPYSCCATKLAASHQ